MQLTPDLLITAYESGYFPMAESRDSDELFWFNPDPRAIIPLDGWHIPRSLKKAVRARPYSLTINQAFAEVMRSCAQPRRDEGDSWISEDIIATYVELHELGYAHSVECWDGDALMGGLYGVSRGGAFFGESMFSRAPNASKIAYVYLLEIVLRAGYGLLDTQFVNPHLEQFGVREIPKADYLAKLDKALIISPNPSHHFAASGGTIISLSPDNLTVIRPASRTK